MSHRQPAADHVSATRFAPNGRDRIGWMWMARGCMWTEENSKPGSATFEVPLWQAPNPRDVVKLTWWRHGEPVHTFACRINGEATQHAVDGAQWVRFEDQPGAVMAWIGDACVYPWIGVGWDSETTKYFGFMSPIHLEEPTPHDLPWFVPEDWSPPVGVPWSATKGGYRDKKPHAFRKIAPEAEWISVVHPSHSQPPGTTNYFRNAVAVPDDKSYEILYTADEYCDFFVDNRLVASGKHDWWTPYRINVHFEGGRNRIFAVKVRNHPTDTGDKPNPCAFICVVRGLKPNGDPDGSILLKTTSANWIAHGNDPEPGWSRANVIEYMIRHAQHRGVSATDYVSFGFTDAIDSDGQHFTDRGQYAFDVGQVTLSDVAQQLSEGFLDVGMDSRTMTLNAYNRRGRDRSAGVQLDVGADGGNMTNYTTTMHAPRSNVLITKTREGDWIEVEGSDSVALWGRIERGMTLGGTVGRRTAETVARKQITENGHARTYVAAESVPELGPVPYVHYGIGDTISVPRRRAAGYMTARVLAITVDGSGDLVRAWPEFVQDSGDG